MRTMLEGNSGIRASGNSCAARPDVINVLEIQSFCRFSHP
jgi:hypothetical protein